MPLRANCSTTTVSNVSSLRFFLPRTKKGKKARIVVRSGTSEIQPKRPNNTLCLNTLPAMVACVMPRRRKKRMCEPM